MQPIAAATIDRVPLLRLVASFATLARSPIPGQAPRSPPTCTLRSTRRPRSPSGRASAGAGRRRITPTRRRRALWRSTLPTPPMQATTSHPDRRSLARCLTPRTMVTAWASTRAPTLRTVKARGRFPTWRQDGTRSCGGGRCATYLLTYLLTYSLTYLCGGGRCAGARGCSNGHIRLCHLPIRSHVAIACVHPPVQPWRVLQLVRA